MKYDISSTKEILDFEKSLPVELVVHKRLHKDNLKTYYVSFESTGVIEGATWKGVMGEGNSIDEAILDYCDQISGTEIVCFNDENEKRQLFQVPTLVYSNRVNHFQSIEATHKLEQLVSNKDLREAFKSSQPIRNQREALRILILEVASGRHRHEIVLHWILIKLGLRKKKKQKLTKKGKQYLYYSFNPLTQ